MSSLKQRFLSGLLTFVMVFTFTLSVSAASFSDVNTGDWYYETVTTMTEKGLFKGKGNNMFCPNDTMTKAEFLAVTMRIICPDANLKAENTLAWWQPAYNLAKQAEIIDETVFPIDSMENVITRQEMAYISSMAFFAQKDGNPDDAQNKEDILLATQVSLSAHNSQQYGFDIRNTIPDYDEIGNDYKGYAVIAYATGLLGGVDDTGRFAPTNTLTRAEGATVLYRLVNESKRLKVTVNTGGGTTTPVNAAITIYEGQARYNRNAQEGDIFVKKDGTQIVLKKGPNGVLGEGQGVAPDVGLLGQVTEKGCNGFRYKVADYGNWYDSTGEHLQGHHYWVNKSTGEGHWTKELHALAKKYPVPDRDGAYEGEVSSDPYSLWVWEYGDWSYNSTNR